MNKNLENSQLDSTDQSRNLRKDIMELVSQYCRSAHQPKSFQPGKTLIPVSGKVYDENELQTLVASSLDFWLTSGRFNEEFQEKLSEFLGVNFTITTNSGSSANLLALTSLTSERLGDDSLKSGDEVITAAAGFPTTINPILQNDLVPVFVDVDISTYAIKTELLEDAITEKTKAMMLPHTLGNPLNLDTIKHIAEKHNLWLIEDCCDALGSTYGGNLVGTFGDIATLSFYPAHHITMGEGGAVLTNDAKLMQIIESFRDWGRDCFCAPGKSNTCGKRFEWQLGELPYGYDHKYTYSHLGYNLKITEMQAAVGLAQMDKLPKFIQARKNNFQFLKQNLTHLEEYFILPEATKNSDPSWFGFPITVKPQAPFSRDDVIAFLSSKLIDTRPLFAGNVIKQPYFKNRKYRIYGTLTNTDLIMTNTFWIGVFPGINEEMLRYVVAQFNEFVKSHVQKN
ncbi:MAG: lipopolysaccharide biosynthesis protein RfbH [Nitrosotalea sp.]